MSARHKSARHNWDSDIDKKAEEAWLESLSFLPSLPSVYEEILQTSPAFASSDTPGANKVDNSSLPALPERASGIVRASSSIGKNGAPDAKGKQIGEQQPVKFAIRTAQLLERLGSLDTMLDECYSEVPTSDDYRAFPRNGGEANRGSLLRRHELGLEDSDSARSQMLPRLVQTSISEIHPIPETTQADPCPGRSNENERLGRDSFRRWTLGSTAENPVEARARRRLKEYHRGPVQPGRRLHHVLPADVRARLSSSARPLNRLDKKAQEIVMKIAEMQESPDLCAELESRIKLQQAERQKQAGNRAAIRRNKELAKISSPSHRARSLRTAAACCSKPLSSTFARGDSKCKEHQIRLLWAHACARAFGLHSALHVLQQQVLQTRLARKSQAAAMAIQRLWRAVHARRFRAAAVIQSACRMHFDRMAFLRDITSIRWMQQRIRRNHHNAALKKACQVLEFVRAICSSLWTRDRIIAALPKAKERLAEAKLLAELEALKNHRASLIADRSRSVRSKISPSAPVKLARSLSETSSRAPPRASKGKPADVRPSTLGTRPSMTVGNKPKARPTTRKAKQGYNRPGGDNAVASGNNSGDPFDKERLMLKGQEYSTCKTGLRKKHTPVFPEELIWR